MKNINETVKSKYLIYILFLAGGLLLGWLLFHNSDTDSHTSQASETGIHRLHVGGDYDGVVILDGPFQGSRLAVLIIDTEHVEELRGDESIAAGHLQCINPPNEVTASHIIRHPPIRKAGRFHAGVWLPILKITEAGDTSFIRKLENAMEDNSELKRSIQSNARATQLTFDF